MPFINEGDPFRPVLVSDGSKECKAAEEELKKANIFFEIWDIKDVGAVGKPPYLLRGRLKYLGLQGIREFINSYPGILRSERA
jgi:hypothetical protein